MYPTQFGFPPSSNSVLVPTPYMGVLSNYDYFDSIPFPFISCSFDPQYEMLWCSTQNVGMGVRISLSGISKRILPIQSSCIYNMQSTQMQERGGCVTRSGQITVTEYGMNIYNQGGMLRGKWLPFSTHEA